MLLKAFPALLKTWARHQPPYLSSEFPVTAFTPEAAASTVVSTTVAVTLTAVETTETAASATATTAQPLQRPETSRRTTKDRIIRIEVGVEKNAIVPYRHKTPCEGGEKKKEEDETTLQHVSIA